MKPNKNRSKEAKRDSRPLKNGNKPKAKDAKEKTNPITNKANALAEKSKALTEKQVALTKEQKKQEKAANRAEAKEKTKAARKSKKDAVRNKINSKPKNKSRFFASASGITEGFYKAVQNSFIGKLMTSYKSHDKKEGSKNGILAHYIGKLELKKNFTIPAKRFFNRQFENSTILSFLRTSIRSLLSLPVKFYGILAFSFGMYTSAAYIIMHYVLGSTLQSISQLYTGLLCAAITSPLIFMKGSLSKAITESRILKFILIRFLGIKQERLYSKNEIQGKSYIAFICGMLLGIITMKIECIYIIAAVPIIILAYIVLIQPESGVTLMLLLIPIMQSQTFAVAAICYTFFCYLLKLICGKRTFKLKSADAFMLIFAFLLLCSGSVSISGESQTAVLPFFCFAMGYFLVTNLINSTERAYRCIYAIVISSACVAINLALNAFLGSAALINIGTAKESLSLAEYLIITFPIILAFLFVSKSHNARFGAMLTIFLSIGCLAIELPEGALVGLVIGILLFLIIYNKRAFAFVFSLLVILALVYYSFYDWLPSGIINMIKLLSNPYSLSSGRATGLVDLINACLLCGVGFGGEAFSTAYAYFARSAVPSTDFANNMFIQIITETGIAGLIILLIAIVLAMREYFSFLKSVSDRKSAKPVIAYSAACIGGISAALIYGSTPGIWHNFRIMPLFYMIFGLLSAITRASNSEKTECIPDGPYTELYYPLI